MIYGDTVVLFKQGRFRESTIFAETLARARKREQPRFFLFRWTARLGTLPVVVIYVFFAYFTQYLSWYGSFSLFEQHAFLTPVPFLGL